MCKNTQIPFVNSSERQPFHRFVQVAGQRFSVEKRRVGGVVVEELNYPHQEEFEDFLRLCQEKENPPR